ncbi:MAG TPA: ribosome biogenesis GTP-binding protein YihA/YsxC [Ignavibacteria bacterium]
MKLKVNFFKSIFKVEDLFKSDLPEFVFLGRSNVGKSTLINTLTGVKNLAKTSSTPGKTQSINYYNVDNKYYIVDMPGYGYAKISQEKKLYWKKLTEKYFTENSNILMCYVLVDSRYDIMESDIMMIEFLSFLKKPITILLTKIDKTSQGEVSKRIQKINSISSNKFIIQKIIPTSSVNNKGIKDILLQIKNLLSA